MPIYRVSDTVTYARSWTVYAVNEDDAIFTACDVGPSADMEQEQIDNTPYEAEEVTE